METPRRPEEDDENAALDAAPEGAADHARPDTEDDERDDDDQVPP